MDGVLERVTAISTQAANEMTHMSGSHTLCAIAESVALIGSGLSGPASSATLNWSKSQTIFFFSAVFSDA